MKIKSEIYAKTLLDAISDQKADKETIVRNFWYTLQKNGQYKDLKKIMEKIDEEYAKNSDLVFAKVYSAKSLPESEIELIKQKIRKKYNKDVWLSNIVRRNIISGVLVKVEDSEIDISLEGKIERLKQLLKS